MLNDKLVVLQDEKEKLQTDYRQQLHNALSSKQDVTERLTNLENELSRCKQDRDKAKLQTKQQVETVEALKALIKSHSSEVEQIRAKANEEAAS